MRNFSFLFHLLSSLLFMTLSSCDDSLPPFSWKDAPDSLRQRGRSIDFLTGAALNKRQTVGAQSNKTSSTLLRNFQVMQPPVVPQGAKTCRQNILQTTFANSVGQPARVAYSPPRDCGDLGSWASVILSLTVSSQGTQFDRLGHIFLNNVEIMRISTAEPTPEGIIWTIEKDVTKYMPLLELPQGSLVMRLDNTIDTSININGEFNVDLSATYYMPTVDFPALAKAAAIIPLSGNDSSAFSVPGPGTVAVKIPSSASSAFVEIYASGASQEEFWYTNALDQAIPALHGKSSSSDSAGKGPFREVQLWIDERLAGVAYPFPVIFTGGILLTFWRPMAGYGSLDLPTYTIDITPFLPLLTDYATHNFTLTVEGQGLKGSINANWYLSGNIAVVLDPSGKRTVGKIHKYSNDPATQLGGEVCGADVFTSVEAGRKLSITSTITTGTGGSREVSFTQNMKFENKQSMTSNGLSHEVVQLSTGSSVTQTASVVTFSDQFSFPLSLSLKNSASNLKGDLSHGYYRAFKPAIFNGFATSIQTNQTTTGTLDLDGDNRATGGTGQTGQVLAYTDERGSTYQRDVLINNVTQVLRDLQSGSLSNSGLFGANTTLSSFPDSKELPSTPNSPGDLLPQTSKKLNQLSVVTSNQVSTQSNFTFRGEPAKLPFFFQQNINRL